MAKKKKVDKMDEMTDNNDLLDEGEIVEFVYDKTAYLPVFNETRKAFDMYLIRVNTETHDCHVEIEEMKYDSEMRASMDLKNRYANDLVKDLMKIKKQKGK